ncbi:MAG: hypothetical protein AAFR96_03230 [Planctomycetota bacterium]
MKRTLIAQAIALATAAQTHAQDLLISFVPIRGMAGTYVVTAQFTGGLPAGTTDIASIWVDTQFEIAGGGARPVEFIATNPAYTSAIFGGPRVRSGSIGSFTGTQALASLGGQPDPSDPLFVTIFSYQDSVADLQFTLIGQNSAGFTGNPNEPFGTIVLYQDAAGNPGPLTFGLPPFPTLNSIALEEIPWIPAPASCSVVALAGLAAARRRRK